MIKKRPTSYRTQLKNVNVRDISINTILRKKCPYSELFWSVFSRILTEYGEIQSISLHLFEIRENEDQNNSEY